MNASIRFAVMAIGLAVILGQPISVNAEGLDWEVQESTAPSAPVRVVRNVRDGLLTFVDAFFDANTAVFGAFSLTASQLTLVVADGIGLVDDNPITQHVTKGILSKNLAKTAYLWHVAGAESVLGGHGQEKERWATSEVASLNPLLSDDDVDALEPPIPLDPLDFVGEGLVHTKPLRPNVVLQTLGATLVADVVMRPAAGVLRVFQLRETGDRIEDNANALFRTAARSGW